VGSNQDWIADQARSKLGEVVTERRQFGFNRARLACMLFVGSQTGLQPAIGLMIGNNAIDLLLGSLATGHPIRHIDVGIESNASFAIEAPSNPASSLETPPAEDCLCSRLRTGFTLN